MCSTDKSLFFIVNTFKIVTLSGGFNSRYILQESRSVLDLGLQVIKSTYGLGRSYSRKMCELSNYQLFRV